MIYTPVEFDDIVSPIEDGLYEFDGTDYEPSEDALPIQGKTYYIEEDDYQPEYYEVDVDVGDSVIGMYELVSGEYVLTSDGTAIAGKSYYDYFDGDSSEPPLDDDSLYYLVPEDEIECPVLEELYEKDENGYYVLSEDDIPDPDKQYYLPYDSIDRSIDEEDMGEPYVDPREYVPEVIVPVPMATEDPEPSNFIYAYTQLIADGAVQLTPAEAGFYEVIDGVYVLTSDTELVRGKVYYEYRLHNDYYVANMEHVQNPKLSLTNYYEIVNGEYVLTQDTTVAVGKTYYRSQLDDRRPYLPDPNIGKTPMTYDDIPLDSELETETEP